MAECHFKDPVVQSACEFVERVNRQEGENVAMPVDVGTTRTDFPDPHHPVRYVVDAGDGISDPQEYLQAFIRLGEIAIGRRGEPWAKAYGEVQQSTKMRIFWLPSDPELFEKTPRGEDAGNLARFYFEKAEYIWDGTFAEKDLGKRRKIFAKKLFEAMVLPPGEKKGFNISFFNPEEIDERTRTNHPFYSRELDCIGNWLYGILCERFGIPATPVQVFTNEKGTVQYHILTAIYFDPDRPILAGFQPGEAGFDITLAGESTWAPISRLEFLAYIHITRAFDLYPNNREKQLKELAWAYRHAPYNYVVNYQMGLHFSIWGEREMAKFFFGESLQLNPFYTPALERMVELGKQESLP